MDMIESWIPPERSTRETNQECVLETNREWLHETIRERIGKERTVCAGVGRKRFSCRCISITHDEEVVDSIGARTERIFEDAAWLHDNFGIITRCLTSRGSIKVPLRKIVNSLDLRKKANRVGSENPFLISRPQKSSNSKKLS